MSQDTTQFLLAFGIGILAGAAAGTAGFYLATRTPNQRDALLRKAQDYNVRALRAQA